MMTSPPGWRDAQPQHLVALYGWLHGEVYGAEPLELKGEAWWGAGSAAGKLVREEFGGSVAAALDYVRWVWRRERAREKKAAEQDARRIGWRLMFCMRHLLTDYRVANARSGRRVNG